MKPDQERVNNLLRDTVTLLCKNGLTYSNELRVEAIIGVTVDSNDVFLVHINERFGPGGETKTISQVTKEGVVKNGSQALSNNASRDRPTSQQSPSQTMQRTASTDSGSVASPSLVTRRSGSTTAPRVDLSRVKLESVEAGEEIDSVDECLIVHSPQAVARPAYVVAGQRRTPNRHNSSSFHHPAQSSQQGHPSTTSGDDAQAMRQQYSQSHSIASSDGSFTDYDPDTGEPPVKIKKQLSDDQGGGDEGDDSSAYYHGGGQQDNSSQWPNLADIAAQQAHHAFQESNDSHMAGDGTGSLPGCSTWPMPAGSQRPIISGTPGTDMQQQYAMYNYGRSKPKYPNINLSSANIRGILLDNVVGPVMASQNAHVTAFRLVWRSQEEEELEKAWKNIVKFRDTIDSAIKALPGVSFFVSAISGTVSIHSRTDQKTDIYPAIAYWVVGRLPLFSESNLMNMMMANRLGATIRQISKRRRLNETNIGTLTDQKAATLFMVVKDYGKGFVRDKLETLNPNATPAVRFTVSDMNYMISLEKAQSRLTAHGFMLFLELF